ncbi:sigma-70 family RNA polymerase sigma factor [Mycolicibacterium palauense]|uniref:sigma-70 family RNA polymerase sigma factor n=1 Tax=Mycolicibacterium palauense TaxID=2034511 RepID=UPI000BFEB9B0|nr:sigma-70 family RNA polymerase sigma factor [Mycolicibacterium palauense]
MPLRPRHQSSAKRADRGLDDQLLTTLHSAHADEVWRFVAGHISDPQTRDEIVQETFVRAWRNIDRIDMDNGNPRSFLFTTAHNLMVDQWRLQSRRGEVMADTDLTAPTADTVNKSLERILIGDSLRRLSPEHRQVIKALYFDDLTVAEAAERLDIAVGTVKSRSYYALRALRAVFDEMGLL